MSQPALGVLSAPPSLVRDDVARVACDAYVAAHPQASTYHRPAWLDVIAAAFGHRTMYLAAETDGRVSGVLPLVFFRSRLFGRFVVSMPFLNYGGILADGPDVERVLLERAVEEASGARASHLELRHTRQHFAELAPKRHKVAMELRLSPAVDLQWQALDKKVRNQVRKAEKSGLETCQGGTELLPQFYRVFSRNMRDLGTPVYDVSFFRRVLETFPQETRLFVVVLGGRPVAASLVHWYGRRIEVPWASSIRDFNPLCANVLLYWQMVRFAVERGFPLFDFGRSTPGEGTYHFKQQWGAEPRELVWEYWTSSGHPAPELSPRNPKFELAIRAWQRLPVGVASRLGPIVVRNIP